MRTPYSDLPNYHYHSRTIKGAHPSQFDPIVKPKFTFSRDVKIMTMGSCFAQHLSKWLIKNEFNLLLKEQDSYQGGGMFSANYGNVYTVQQAEQIFDRAFEQFSINDELYENNEGNFVDPLRPSTMPEGLVSQEAVLADRKNHESVVKELFLNADVLVFTLGLTETWQRISDQAILPIAPGVVAGEFDEALYTFKNFSYEETYQSLTSFINKLHSVNPNCKVLLTVSPVPLAATYEDKHIAVASMASKAILRAVVEQAIKNFEFVEYFPSFEIFYTPGIGGGYFDFDARHVLPSGVSHAMRLFKKHFTQGGDVERDRSSLSQYAEDILKNYHNVNCDEGKIG